MFQNQFIITNFLKFNTFRNFRQHAKFVSKGGAARIAELVDSLTLKQRVEGKDGGSGGEAQSDSQAAWRQLHLPPITAHLATWTHLI